MRLLARFTFLMTALCIAASTATAQTDCKRCREQQQACQKNYSAQVCKNEYDICMKG
jgi:hypothetical protein